MMDLDFREIRDNDDILEIVRMQREVWGFDDMQISPPDLLKVHKSLGGTVFGAFTPEGTAVAFCYSFCGILDGEPMHWSHMLGVATSWRGKGLGTRLKWMQREHMLKQGVRLCQWTWDPLEPVNTYLNIAKLGVVTNRYEIDVYDITSGPLHLGLPTDRFVADWRVESDRVAAAAAGRAWRIEDQEIPLICDVQNREDALPVPGEVDIEIDSRLLAFPVISGIMAKKFDYPEEAMAWRHAMRAAFVPLFERGYRLADVHSSSRLDDKYFEYILEKADD